ncbi:MAG TPA: PGPGW domain-containing protein [Microbacteriaceae bacterium]|nr:PGPGW domain-containing protein [Microbacteriaceae bacterium]
MPDTDDAARGGFWRKAARWLHETLVRFRAFVERHRWLTIVYKVTLALVGGVIILAGIAMLVLPGPGWLTIFFGFALLGTEFVWARKVILWLRQQFAKLVDRWRRYRSRKKGPENGISGPE